MKSINSIDSTDQVDEATKLLPLFQRISAPGRIVKQQMSKFPTMKLRRMFTEKDLRRIHYLRS